MFPLQDSCLKTLVLVQLLSLTFITSTLISAHQQNQPQKQYLFGRTTRVLLLELGENDNDPIITKKKTSSSTTGISTKNNQSKLIKPTSNSSKNQTNLIKTSSVSSYKNNTIKTNKTNPSDHPAPATTKSQLKKLDNSNSSQVKNRTTNPTTSKETRSQSETTRSKFDKAERKQPRRNHDDDGDDLVAEFRDLPSKFQETFIPDLEKISKTSRIYLKIYNREFAEGFKPYFGDKYASTTASIASFAFLLIPLVIVTLIFNRIKAYFSLQKLLIFIQIYLAIYFTILCSSALATGLEPLRFFYSTSRSTYVCVQVLQTLGYVLYLLILLMYLILVFSTDTGLATKLLGLGQTFVGFSIGLHYYMTVFRRAVLGLPPKSGWKVHGLYAMCFLVICLLGKVDRRKKAYLEEGGEEGKKS